MEGAWSPVMKMTIGYCEYECTLCSQVCPTGAIRPLDIAAKQAIRIGLAYIDRNRCLPYAYARSCIVCEEHCPTPRKAIWLEEVEVPGPRRGACDGQTAARGPGPVHRLRDLHQQMRDTGRAGGAGIERGGDCGIRATACCWLDATLSGLLSSSIRFVDSTCYAEILSLSGRVC